MLTHAYAHEPLGTSAMKLSSLMLLTLAIMTNGLSMTHPWTTAREPNTSSKMQRENGSKASERAGKRTITNGVGVRTRYWKYWRNSIRKK